METKHKIGLGIISAVFVYLVIFAGMTLVDLIRIGLKRPVKAFATDGKALRVFDRDTAVYYPKLFYSRDLRIDGQKAYAWIKSGQIIVQIGEKKITHPCNTAKIPIWSPTKPELYYLDSLADYPRKKQIWKWSQSKGFEAITEPKLDLSYLVFSVDGNHLTTFNNRYIDHLVNRMLVWSTAGKLEHTFETSNAISRAVMIGPDDYLLAPMNTATFQRQHPSIAHAFRFTPSTKKLAPFKIDGRQVRDVIALDGQVWVMFQKSNLALTPFKISRGDDKGRVAVLGHGSILNKPGNEAMSETLFRWVHQSRKPIGLFSDVSISPAFGEPLTFRGLGDLKSATEKCGTLVLDQAPFDGNREAINLLDAYVKNGGGLVMEGPVWGWLQLHPGQRLSVDHSGQILLSRMGLGFADGTIGGSTIQLLPAQPAHHIGRALAMVRSKRVLLPEEAKLVGETLETAIDSLRADNLMQAELKSMLTSDQKDVIPTKVNPLTSANFQLRIAAQYYDKSWRSLPPDQVKAHPASADFPGLVTSSDRTDMSVKIGGKVRRWWSTGAYAAPGEVITVRIPAELQGLGVRLRIGGHNDTLWHLDKWERFPSICLEVPIKNGIAKAANPFGGLVYLVCNKSLPSATVEIDHVVTAPVYVLGQTSSANWEKLRNSAAPWGEVVANNCVVCVPSSVLKTLDDPKAVAEYWDEVVEQVEFLYSVPNGTNEERYQADRQISAGYMHSGYPIMTWEDVSAKFVDIKILRGNNGDTNWGFYHEIGHNFQRQSWTWDGWGETTNNLYSLFGGEHFNHDLTGGHGAMKVEQREKRMKEVLAAPGADEYFHKDPWYGLTFLRAIREEFGWQPFQMMFAEFRDLPRNEQPKNEQEKQDQFLLRMSRILKKDLSHYFQVWGVKNSDAVVQQCKAWPLWMPSK